MMSGEVYFCGKCNRQQPREGERGTYGVLVHMLNNPGHLNE